MNLFGYEDIKKTMWGAIDKLKYANKTNRKKEV